MDDAAQDLVAADLGVVSVMQAGGWRTPPRSRFSLIPLIVAPDWSLSDKEAHPITDLLGGVG
jgi:hypothetical protein